MSTRLLERVIATVRSAVAEHAMVVCVLTRQEGRAGRTAEREVDEAVLERHAPGGDQGPDVGHRLDLLCGLVIGLDHEEVGPPMRYGAMSRHGRGPRRAPDRQGAAAHLSGGEEHYPALQGCCP